MKEQGEEGGEEGSYERGSRRGLGGFCERGRGEALEEQK